MNTNRTVKIQFEMPFSVSTEIEEIRRHTGLRSRTEVWSYAFTLFKWVLQAIARGERIYAYDGVSGVYRDLVMPPLETYAESIKREKKNEGSQTNPDEEVRAYGYAEKDSAQSFGGEGEGASDGNAGGNAGENASENARGNAAGANRKRHLRLAKHA